MGVIVLAFMAVGAVPLAVTRPRTVLYAAIALAPTQFFFVPVRTFFLSPADVLVLALTLGLIVRLARGSEPAWSSVREHRYLLLLVAAYVAGFVVLGFFSRTIVRVPMAFVLSILACEQLRTREHLTGATLALVIAGIVDSAYGLAFIALGAPLHPFRFSGLSGANFTALVTGTAAVAALALAVRAGTTRALILPAILTGLTIGTISVTGVLSLAAAWFLVLRPIATIVRTARVVAGAIFVVVLVLGANTRSGHPAATGSIFALGAKALWDGLLSKNSPTMQQDGVARTTGTIRWEIVKTAWRGIVEHPIIGIGYSKFLSFSLTDPAIRAQTRGEGYYTHNTFLEVLVEGGIVGFTLFVLHWLLNLRQWIRIDAVRGHDALVAASIGGLPVMLVGAVFVNLLLTYTFWTSCGVSLACLNLLRREATVPDAMER